MQLHTLTRPELVFPDLPGIDAGSLLRAFADKLAAAGVVGDADTLYRRLQEREALGSTGIGHGVAIPHCKMEDLDDVVVAVATSREGVEFGAVDDESVHLFFMVLSPAAEPAAHLQSLAAISKWVKTKGHVERILECTSSEEILELLREESG